MKKVLEYLKLTVFVIGVLVGVQVPSFVNQYGHNLDSRVSEAGNSVAEFQDDADKYFAGDMKKLAEYYDTKPDPIIVAGGESIGALVARKQFLKKAQQGFRQSAMAAYFHVFVTPVEEVRVDVWANYSFTVVLNAEAIFISIFVGVLWLALFEVLVVLFAGSLKALRKQKPAEL